MSSERIAAWLEAQDNPSSPDSDKIDHNEGFIEGYVVPRMSRDEIEALDLSSVLIAKKNSPERFLSSTAKGKQPAIMSSKQQTSIGAEVQPNSKQQINDCRIVPLFPAEEGGTKRPPLGGLTSNSTKLSQTRARSTQPERQRPRYKKRRMEAEQNNSIITTTTSKRNVSYDKRKEIPPTSSEPTTISPPAPKSAPPAKRRRTTYKGKEREVAGEQFVARSTPPTMRRKTSYEGKEKEVIAEQLSSQESMHSPWRSIWTVHLPPRREW